jgi:hypothetical protein
MAAATAAARRSSARTAPARTGPGRSAPAKRPTTRPRRSQATPVYGLVPLAVGRTAGAVGGIADSGLVVRLTRGRLWIGALATLLVGIVALNVLALSLNAASSKIARDADGLKRANSNLQARIAGDLSSQEVASAAAKLGLIDPAISAIRYLHPRPGDAAAAARRLASGALTVGTVLPPPPVETATETAAAPVDAAGVTETSVPETSAVTEPAADPGVAAQTGTGGEGVGGTGGASAGGGVAP